MPRVSCSVAWRVGWLSSFEESTSRRLLPTWTVVINADKVRLTGKKLDQKEYFRHTGYIGNAKMTSVRNVLGAHPERVVERAVFGMLPKGTLGRQVLRRKLRVYAGPDHPHAAQQPRILDMKAG